MIQLRYIEMPMNKNTKEELGKVINFLDQEGIEYDLEPSKKFIKYTFVGNKKQIITEPLE